MLKFTYENCRLESQRNASDKNGFQEGKNHSRLSLTLTSFRSQQTHCANNRGPGSLLPATEEAGSLLTDEIGQQNGQEEGGGDGGQGGTFPAAVLGGLLQLEGLPGEGVPGQQAGWRRVNGS